MSIGFLLRSVRGRLLLLAIGVELVMLTLLVTNSLRLLHGAMTDQARWQVHQMMPVLNAALKAPLAQRDSATVQAVLDESRATEGIDYVVVVDRQGHVVGTSGWPIGKELPEPDRHIRLNIFSGLQKYEQTLAIEQSGQRLGALHMGLNLTKISQACRKLLFQGICIALMELVLSSVILALIGYWLMRHLSALAEASMQVASGNLAPTFLHEGRDEVGRLGKAFNVMSRAIADRVKELTQAKEAAESSEQAKSESEKQLILVLDGSNDGFWDWDIPTGRISVNRRWAEMLGYSVDEIQKHVSMWEHLVHPEDLPMVRQILEQHLAGTTPHYESEHRLLAKSGEWKWILDRGKVVEFACDGTPLRAAGTHTDISERKLSEEAVRKSEERVLLLLNSTAEAIFGVDLQGNCTFANPSCLRMLGYSEQNELLGRNMHDLIHHSYPDGKPLPVAECDLCRALYENRIRHWDELKLWRAEGSGFFAECWCHPQVMSGMVNGAVITFNDITERKQAQEELALKQSQLEELNLSLHEQTALLEDEIGERQQVQEQLAVKRKQLEKLNSELQQRVEEAVNELRQRDQMLISQGRQAAMGEMIGNIAHQWRQPLNSLSMLIANLQVARRKNELTEQYLHEYTATANRLIRKMSTTISDFRNFFSPDKEMVLFSAREQIQQAVSLVDAAFKSGNISISIDAEEDCVLNGYPNEYSQVLLNLLSNAKEAIQGAGTISGKIGVTLMKQKGIGVLTVWDNGGGIPEAINDKIFEPYFSTKSMGTGIGLYMSKMIIERNMNGIITASTRGGGAEFKVCIPLGEETE